MWGRGFNHNCMNEFGRKVKKKKWAAAAGGAETFSVTSTVFLYAAEVTLPTRAEICNHKMDKPFVTSPVLKLVGGDAGVAADEL